MLSTTDLKKIFTINSRTLFMNESHYTPQERDSGLTLIECLVAIAVIAATIGVIAPVTVLAVATRVQNQRAEQASFIAQSEIDRIRLTVERETNFTFENIATTSDLDGFPPPADVVGVVTSANASISARAVDIDRDGQDDFAVQVFRTDDANSVVVDSQLVAFELGVRVYRASAVETHSVSELKTDQAGLTMTSGEGEGGLRPLAVLYTTVVKSDNRESLCDYYSYAGDVSSIPAACL